MRATAYRRRIGLTLALGLTFGGLTVVAEAQAAPSPNNRIRGRGGNFGLGLSTGDPTGLTIKWFMHPNHALQADFGWAPLHHGHGRVGGDYLWHPGLILDSSVLDLVPYLGVGVGTMFWGGYYYGTRHGRYRRYRGSGAAMFIRAPILGFGIHWKKVPLDTMMEGSWSPYIIQPDLAHGDFSIKARYYF